eukprot:5085112-Pyramimonas_sp.AAC.1
MMCEITQHLHFPAGIFGTLDVEGEANHNIPILDENGVINRGADIDPCAKQLFDDIEVLLGLDLASDRRDMLVPRSIKILIENEEVRDMHTALDPRTLRGAFSKAITSD